MRPAHRVVALLTATVAAFPLAALTSGPEVAAAGGSSAHISVRPDVARPGQQVTVSGVAPNCAGNLVQTDQHWHDYKLNVNSTSGMGGMVGPDGSFSFVATVPAGIVRSNIQRPFSTFMYDKISVSFDMCKTIMGTNVFIKPLSHRVHITLSQARPRSGSTLRVTATNCLGNSVPGFSQVIDRTGEYFYIKGSMNGTTWQGSVNLAHGLYGADAHGPAAHVSPRGVKDAVVAVPCAQAMGPGSVARREHIMHSSVAVDVSIRRRRS
jgi:hypothetical protein